MCVVWNLSTESYCYNIFLDREMFKLYATGYITGEKKEAVNNIDVRHRLSGALNTCL